MELRGTALVVALSTSLGFRFHIFLSTRPSRRDLFVGITQRSLFRSMESHDNYTLADGMVFTENFTRVSIRQEAAHHVHLINYKRLQVKKLFIGKLAETTPTGD